MGFRVYHNLKLQLFNNKKTIPSRVIVFVVEKLQLRYTFTLIVGLLGNSLSDFLHNFRTNLFKCE